MGRRALIVPPVAKHMGWNGPRPSTNIKHTESVMTQPAANLPPKVTSPSIKAVLIGLVSAAAIWFIAVTIAVLSGVAPDAAAVGAFIGLIVAVILFWNVWQRKQFRKYGYAWYAGSFPQHISERGVRCRHCGSWKVTVRNLMNQTFHRAHVCTQCGRTLYYSPEN